MKNLMMIVVLTGLSYFFIWVYCNGADKIYNQERTNETLRHR
jgi:hypothetical protein